MTDTAPKGRPTPKRGADIIPKLRSPRRGHVTNAGLTRLVDIALLIPVRDHLALSRRERKLKDADRRRAILKGLAHGG